MLFAREMTDASRTPARGVSPSSPPLPTRNGRAIGRPLPPRVLQEMRRQQLAPRFAVVFATKGYPATTIGDLVAAGGIGRQTFYALYRSKEECFDLMLESLIAEAEVNVFASIDSSAPWPVKARQVFAAIFAWANARPEQALAILLVAQAATPGGLARYRGLIDRLAGALGTGRSLLPAGASHPPASFEFALVSGTSYVLVRRLAERDSSPEPVLADQLATFLLDPYLGRAPKSEAIPD